MSPPTRRMRLQAQLRLRLVIAERRAARQASDTSLRLRPPVGAGVDAAPD